jgi:hypothetical protein
VLPFGFGPNAHSMTFKTFKAGRARYTNIYETRRYRNWNIPIDDVSLERWTLALIAFRTYPLIWMRYHREKATSNLTDHPSWNIWEYPSSECQLTLVNPRIPDWPWKDLLDWKHEWTDMTLLATCASIYGAIHITAGMHCFPDGTQRNLWRYSAIIIASTGSLFVLTRYNAIALDFLSNRNLTGLSLLLSRVAIVVLGFFAFAGIYCIAFAYVLARVYLPIGAFVSRRNLPVEVYQSTKWAGVIQAIPHL